MTGQRGAATPPEDARRGVGERVTGPVTLSPEEAARDLAVTRTRQYAKRQETWFRNQFGPDWRRLNDPAEFHPDG